jgi:hypothetical protein
MKFKEYKSPSINAMDIFLNRSFMGGSNIAPGPDPIDPYDDPIDDNDNWS